MFSLINPTECIVQKIRSTTMGCKDIGSRESQSLLQRLNSFKALMMKNAEYYWTFDCVNCAVAHHNRFLMSF